MTILFWFISTDFLLIIGYFKLILAIYFNIRHLALKNIVFNMCTNSQWDMTICYNFSYLTDFLACFWPISLVWTNFLQFSKNCNSSKKEVLKSNLRFVKKNLKGKGQTYWYLMWFRWYLNELCQKYLKRPPLKSGVIQIWITQISNLENRPPPKSGVIQIWITQISDFQIRPPPLVTSIVSSTN